MSTREKYRDSRVDEDRQTVTLGAHWDRPVTFPICDVQCPPTEDQDPTESRSLGCASWFDNEVWIPLENGVILSLQLHPGRLTLCAYSPHCTRQTFEHPDHSDLWLPEPMRPERGTMVRGFQVWDHCEEWWLVEHIIRLGTFPVEQLEGPKVTLAPWAP